MELVVSLLQPFRFPGGHAPEIFLLRVCTDGDLTAAPPQMSILDGNQYDTRSPDSGTERDEDLEACSLLMNNKV
jgi:hypothetical protein